MNKNFLTILAAGLCMSVGAWAEPTKTAEPVKEGAKQEGSPIKEATKDAPKPKVEAERVELIEAGAEPRRVLRYAPKAGEEATMVSSMRQTFVTGPANMPAMPGVEMVYLAKIEKAESAEGGSAGQFVFKREIQDVRVAADDAASPMAAAVAGMAGQMKGQTRVMTVDPMGRVTASQRTGVDGKPLAGAGDRTGLMAERMLAILPQEAVGVGAKWKVVQTQDVGGGRTPIEVETTVTKITETGFEGDVKMTRLAGDEAPPTAGVKVESLTGTGKVKVDLKQPHLSEGSMVMEVKGTMTSRRSAEGQKIELKLETGTKRGE